MCGETSGTPARSAAARRIAHALCRDNRPPLAFKNTAGVPLLEAAPPDAASAALPRTKYAPSASAANDPMGTTRSLRPLPRSNTAASPGTELNVVDVEPRSLRNSRPARVEELKQSPVTQRSRAIANGCVVEDRGHLSSRDGVWQLLGNRARPYRGRGVGGGPTLKGGEAVETAYRDHDARSRGGRHSRAAVGFDSTGHLTERLGEVRDVITRHVGHIDNVAGLKKCLVAGEVSPIGGDRVGAQAALHRDVRQVGVALAGEHVRNARQ